MSQEGLNSQENFYQSRESIKQQINKELGYDSDLIIDEKDEEELEKKTELEKENIMKARYERRQQLLERYEFVKKQQMAMTQPKQQQNNRRDLKLKQKQRISEHSDHSSQCSDCSHHKKKKRKSRNQPSSSSSSSSNSSSSSDSSSSSEDEKPKTIQAKSLVSQKELDNTATLKDAQRIMLSRRQFIQFLDEPYFDEIIQGALAKVSYENRYRVCKVKKAVDSVKEYTVENPTANKNNNNIKNTQLQPILSKKEILCVWGKYEKKFKISMVSNQQPSYDEYHAFQQARVKAGKKLLTKDYCNRKLKHINQLKNKQLRDEEIQQKVRERVHSKIMNGDIKGLNLFVEKRKIITEIEQMEEIERLNRLSQGDMIRIRSQIKSTKELLTKLQELENESFNKNDANVKKEDSQMKDESIDDEEQSQDLKNLIAQVQKQRERDRKYQQRMDSLMRLSYAQRVKFMAEEIQDGLQHIRLGIDFKLEKEDFGGFFQKPVSIDLQNFKFGSTSTQMKQFKTKFEEEQYDSNISLIRFEDYFAA